MAITVDVLERPKSGTARWIGEADVASSVSLSEAISAVRRTYVRAAAGEIIPMPKTYARWDEGTMHAIGAVDTTSGLAVSKTWAHTPAGATPMLVAWDLTTGAVRAMIEAFALGQLRTSAVTGAATASLARDDCAVLGVIGAGKQAEGQIAAVAAVRNIQQVNIFSPTEQHRVEFAAKIAQRSGAASRPAASVKEALSGADIVITVTRARDPFVRAEMLSADVHINAIGAITPERAELEPSVVARAGRVVADDVAAARQLAQRELSPSSAPHVLSLANVLAAGDRSVGGVSVFKAVGSGVSDLAVADMVIKRAEEANIGRTLAFSARSSPNMWST